ncbi:MAG TPA: hypothetical protein VFB66_03145 [Tepidisphaeraceae bacterium]|nr:hypothetical protein [Tepidisphaeraceae bacterium]
MLAIAWPALDDAGRALAWSAWRRHHQAVARRCHYRAREPTRVKYNSGRNNLRAKAQL